jgi:hypothetical protein
MCRVALSWKSVVGKHSNLDQNRTEVYWERNGLACRETLCGEGAREVSSLSATNETTLWGNFWGQYRTFWGQYRTMGGLDRSE